MARGHITIELKVDFRDDRETKEKAITELAREAAANLLATASLLADEVGMKPEVALTTRDNFWGGTTKQDLYDDQN